MFGLDEGNLPISCLQLYLGCRLCPLFAIALQFLGSGGAFEINCQVSKFLTPVLLGSERKTKPHLDHIRHRFCKIVRFFDDVISVSNDRAGIWVPFAPVLISVNYSTHVSLVCFIVPPF